MMDWEVINPSMPGVDGEVNALAVDASGNLYAGGDFATAGGVTVNRIAKWDGTSWSASGLGDGRCYFSLCIRPCR